MPLLSNTTKTSVFLDDFPLTPPHSTNTQARTAGTAQGALVTLQATMADTDCSGDSSFFADFDPAFDPFADLGPDFDPFAPLLAELSRAPKHSDSHVNRAPAAPRATPEQKQEATTLLQTNELTIQQIADRVGLTRSQVKTIKKKFGLTKPIAPAAPRATPEQKQEATTLLQRTNLKIQQIADRVGLTKAQVRSIKKKCGLTKTRAPAALAILHPAKRAHSVVKMPTTKARRTR